MIRIEMKNVNKKIHSIEYLNHIGVINDHQLSIDALLVHSNVSIVTMMMILTQNNLFSKHISLSMKSSNNHFMTNLQYKISSTVFVRFQQKKKTKTIHKAYTCKHANDTSCIRVLLGIHYSAYIFVTLFYIIIIHIDIVIKSYKLMDLYNLNEIFDNE